MPFLVLFLLACGLNLALAQEAPPRQPGLQILSLVDYIAGDYSSAVASDGSIQNEAEYAELASFAAAAVRHFDLQAAELSASQRGDLRQAFSDLQDLISRREKSDVVVAKVQALHNLLIAAFHLQTAPRQAPSLARGEELYQQACASCHGMAGKGDGLAANGMVPPPRNFFEQGKSGQGSPFKIFNTLVNGIENTAMSSYAAQFDDASLWDLSFYTSALSQGVERSFADPSAYWQSLSREIQQELIRSKLGPQILSSLSDAELKDELRTRLTFLKDANEETLKKWIQDLRLYAAYIPELASNRVSEIREGDLSRIPKALKKLDAAQEAFLLGNHNEAENFLLAAYLEDFEGLERAMRIQDPSLVRRVEQAFMDARSYALSGAKEDFLRQLAELRDDLGLVQEHLESKEAKGNSAWADLAASLIIIVREGFEAFLIIAALLALLGNLGFKEARIWVHAAWFAAIVAGFISYAIMQKILRLSGAARETLEAVTTGCAVLLLFYSGFWLLNQAEQKRWQTFIRTSSKTALSSRRLSSVFLISFIAVYREAVETMLFYEALLSGASSSFAVGLGFVLGCLLLGFVCLLIVRFNLRLPLQQFFRVTSALMLGISIILMGKLTHELVEAGFFQATPLPGLPLIEMIGFYPSLETILAQMILISAAIGLGLYQRLRVAA